MIDFEILLRRSRGESRQFLVLIRHFFKRLFLNDMFSFEEKMKEKVVISIVFLAVFAGHVSNLVLLKYLMVPDRGTSWLEKCYVMCLFMVLMGFVSVFEWDVVFLDARDYSNLIPLPLRLRTLFTAKFTSLCLFVGMFALGMNTLSTFIFTLYLPSWHSQNPVYLLRFALVHLVSVFLANFFVFFVSALIIGLLTSLLGYRMFSRISVYFRTALMIFFIAVMFYFLNVTESIPQFFSRFPVMKESGSLFLYLFPPMWFTGLYENLLGNSDQVFSRLSQISLLAVVLPALVFFLVAALGHRRYFKKMREVKKGNVFLMSIKSTVANTFNSLFLRNPVQRAIFYFFGKTLKKSMIHKMRLASYLAISSGIVLVAIIAEISHSPDSIKQVNATLLSVSLVLSFCLLLGVRSVVNIPYLLDANWVFKITEKQSKSHYFLGLKKGIIFYTLIPLFLLFFILYSYFWGWQNGLLHCIYGLTISLIVLEVLFYTYRKIPFACSYLPGKGRLEFLWIVYLIAFLLYLSFFSFIESRLFLAPSRFVIFYLIFLLLYLSNRMYQNYFLYKKVRILYEEEPEPVMVTLVAYDPL